METAPTPRKIFARSPNSAMWLGKGESCGWVALNDFSKAWAFDGRDEAAAAWAKASRGCLERCALDGREAPAWALAEPVFLEGRTVAAPPSVLEYWLGMIDGRFISQRAGQFALSADEREAKAFGSLSEAAEAVESMRTKHTKAAAVLPITCALGEPVAVGSAPLDALAQAMRAKSLRDEYGREVPEGKGSGSAGAGRL